MKHFDGDGRDGCSRPPVRKGQGRPGASVSPVTAEDYSSQAHIRKGQARPGASVSFGSVAAIVVGVLVLAAAVYIMINGLGLNPDLDFGAGAYYYADIPDYQKTLDWDVYSDRLPFWVYLLLFLGWGALMWRLWKHLDDRSM